MAERGKIRVGDYILKHGIFATPCKVVYIFESNDEIFIELDDGEIMFDHDIPEENVRPESELEHILDRKDAYYK